MSHRNMDVYTYESIKMKKAEQNEVARLFFKCLGGGFGLSKKYRCHLCGEVGTAPSPRLMARYHRHKHPEIEEAFLEAGLLQYWLS